MWQLHGVREGGHQPLQLLAGGHLHGQHPQHFYTTCRGAKHKIQKEIREPFYRKRQSTHFCRSKNVVIYSEPWVVINPRHPSSQSREITFFVCDGFVNLYCHRDEKWWFDPPSPPPQRIRCTVRPILYSTGKYSTVGFFGTHILVTRTL